MDVFSHALWTNLLYYPKYKDRLATRLWAAFFGVLPDLISFTPTTLYLLFSGSHFPREMTEVPAMGIFDYAFYSYNFTHSLVIFVLVLAGVLIVRRGRMWWPLLGWLFHIVLDVFTHKADFFATPIFFPISDIKYLHQFSWAEPHFLLINWIVLALLYGVVLYHGRKRVTLSPLAPLPTVLYHASAQQGLTEIHPRAESTRDLKEGAVVFATPDLAIASMFLVRAQQHSGLFSGVRYYVAIKREFLEKDTGGSIYELRPEGFSYDAAKGLGELEWTSRHSVVPTKEIKCERALDFMISQGVQVYLVEPDVFSAIDVSPDHGFSILSGLISENEVRHIHVQRLVA